jgi:hypothetical protein
MTSINITDQEAIDLTIPEACETGYGGNRQTADRQCGLEIRGGEAGQPVSARLLVAAAAAEI